MPAGIPYSLAFGGPPLPSAPVTGPAAGHFATSDSLTPSAEAISELERPDWLCNFTMLQSTCEPPMPAHPANAVANRNAPVPIKIPIRPLRSIIESSPCVPGSSLLQRRVKMPEPQGDWHDIIN